jgi:hypothetical protein
MNVVVLPHYSRERTPGPFNSRMDRPQSHSGRFGEDKTFASAGIQTPYLQPTSLAAIPTKPALFHVFRHLRKISKASISFGMSVCTSVRMEQVASNLRIFMKFDISVFLEPPEGIPTLT